jgi:hypothetical protein
LSHPCPILAKGNFQAAFDTFHGGVDLLNHIKGNVPVAFRTPCCDSINSPSPRLYAEIFNRTTRSGQFLQADSSVMNILSTNDPVLPRELVVDADGKKFPQCVPFPSFVTTIENYPYPYVVGKLCWEFPRWFRATGSSTARHQQSRDRGRLEEQPWTRAVLKQGIFNFIFHPHGWILPPKWLSSSITQCEIRQAREVPELPRSVERLNQNCSRASPFGRPTAWTGVRLLDANHDRYGCHCGNERSQKRVWQPRRSDGARQVFR